VHALTELSIAVLAAPRGAASSTSAAPAVPSGPATPLTVPGVAPPSPAASTTPFDPALPSMATGAATPFAAAPHHAFGSAPFTATLATAPHGAASSTLAAFPALSGPDAPTPASGAASPFSAAPCPSSGSAPSTVANPSLFFGVPPFTPGPALFPYRDTLLSAPGSARVAPSSVDISANRVGGAGTPSHASEFLVAGGHRTHSLAPRGQSGTVGSDGGHQSPAPPGSAPTQSPLAREPEAAIHCAPPSVVARSSADALASDFLAQMATPRVFPAGPVVSAADTTTTGGDLDGPGGPAEGALGAGLLSPVCFPPNDQPRGAQAAAALPQGEWLAAQQPPAQPRLRDNTPWARPPLRPGAAAGTNTRNASAQGAAPGTLHPGDSAAMEEQVPGRPLAFQAPAASTSEFTSASASTLLLSSQFPGAPVTGPGVDLFPGWPSDAASTAPRAPFGAPVIERHPPPVTALGGTAERFTPQHSALAAAQVLAERAEAAARMARSNFLLNVEQHLPSVPSAASAITPHPPPSRPPLPPAPSLPAGAARFRMAQRRAREAGDVNALDTAPPSQRRAEERRGAPDLPDIPAWVDQAQAFEERSRQQYEELSRVMDAEDSMVLVRDDSILELSALSGQEHADIEGILLEFGGDLAGTFITTLAASLPEADSRGTCRRAGLVELSRRRRHRDCSRISQAVASSAEVASPAAAFASLSERLPLASQLGYSYRVDTSGIQLPPIPDRPVHAVRRQRSSDDLEDFVVDDHDSPPSSPIPLQTRARVNAPLVPSDGSDGDDSSSSVPGDDSASGDDSAPGDDSDSGGSSDSSGSSDLSDSSDTGRRAPPPAGGGRAAAQNPPPPPPPPRAGCEESGDALTPSRLAALLEKTLSRAGGNNGLMAPKPNFWSLGNPPQGGYHLETFSRFYREFKEFRKVYGKHTGISFKNLITGDVAPLIRHDLGFDRKQWKKISSSALIKALKARLGYQESDHYIALLEACPKLPDKIKDTAALSLHFKNLSAKMLEILERARKNKVRLRSASLKHVFSAAIKSNYRMTNWFHLEKFKDIGTSVRSLNTKIKARLSQELERQHEQAQDAHLAGVRGQFQGGTRESSDAPERPGKQRPGSKGGITKNSKSPSDKNSGGPFSNLSPGEYRKKMDELYKIENQLPKGRHFHLQTPFCDGENCRSRRCQGCGEHSVKDKPSHDRPHCPHRKHKDFVAEGYFHERWPGRLSIFARNIGDQPTHLSNAQQRQDYVRNNRHPSPDQSVNRGDRPNRSDHAARVNHSGVDDQNASSQ
jgi:hypothetical protein